MLVAGFPWIPGPTLPRSRLSLLGSCLDRGRDTRTRLVGPLSERVGGGVQGEDGFFM